MDIVGSGDETWRSVSIQFTRDAAWYAMDAEFEKNFIYRIDRRTGRRDRIVGIEGPVYYSCAVGEDLFFAVTAELCPSQAGLRCAVLWHIDPSGNSSRVVEYQKDRWSVPIFLPGALYFPQGPGDGTSFYFQGTALAGADNRTFRVRRSG
jgi:hypothetical protein